MRSSPPKKNIEMAKRKKKSEMPGISDAELLVLKELWNSGPAGPSGLRALLAADGVVWAYTTVQTLLHRLLEKGFVSRSKDGVTQTYRPEVSRKELLMDQVSNLAARVGGDGTPPLVMNLVSGKRLSKRDITRLRAMLDSAEANRGQLPKD
ncbi:MAG: BlaI family penicillinase repressor [Gammaproteobacteria bacterium]